MATYRYPIIDLDRINRIALIMGPIAGISMHRGSVPGDHLPPTAEAKFEAWRTALATDSAHWRRTALVAAATLTIGIVL